MGMDRASFDAYLEGARQPSAIVVASAASLLTPVGLDELRRRDAAFIVPQSYRFLRAGELPNLLNGQAHRLGDLGITPAPGFGTASKSNASPRSAASNAGRSSSPAPLGTAPQP
jgi:hypothetical protein